MLRALGYLKEMEEEERYKGNKATNMFLNCDFLRLYLESNQHIFVCVCDCVCEAYPLRVQTQSD